MSASETATRKSIESHIEQHIGPIEHVYRSSAASSDIAIAHVAPSDTRPVHTLITLGLSDRAMSVPRADMPARMEIMMTLPREWRIAPEVTEERWTWPQALLSSIASRAHTQDGWLAWGHLIPNGEPPAPYASSTRQCAALIVPSLLVPTDFYELRSERGTIVFYAVVPLYREELELARTNGTDALFTRLIDRDVNDVVDPARRNVARKRFWLFG
jgi:hypothetical protein